MYLVNLGYETTGTADEAGLVTNIAKKGDPATVLPMYGRGYRVVRCVGPEGGR